MPENTSPDATAHPVADRRTITRSGFGRILIAVYAIFSVAAVSRSAVQIITQFEVAPTAYVLSAVAAVFYIVGTYCMAHASAVSLRVARWSAIIELAGVLVVGTISYVIPGEFPDATVWSHFGSGYLFIPVVLPIAALWWLDRSEKMARAA